MSPHNPGDEDNDSQTRSPLVKMEEEENLSYLAQRKLANSCLNYGKCIIFIFNMDKKLVEQRKMDDIFWHDQWQDHRWHDYR